MTLEERLKALAEKLTARGWRFGLEYPAHLLHTQTEDGSTLDITLGFHPNMLRGEYLRDGEFAGSWRLIVPFDNYDDLDALADRVVAQLNTAIVEK